MARDDDEIGLDAAIAALERSLEVLRAQRDRINATRGKAIKYGTLRTTILEVMGRTVLPLSPKMITRMLHGDGYRVDSRTVASVLILLSRDGLVVSLGRAQWRRADLHRHEVDCRPEEGSDPR